MEETFTYDSQNRLTGVWLGATQTGASAYDGYGRMTAKTANGQPVFSNAVFNTTAKPHTMDAATTVAGVFPTDAQTVTYTGFDKAAKVKQGNDSICYAYGYDRQRILMEQHVGNNTRTKRYVGNCELVTESDGDSTATFWLTYLTGPTGVYAVVVTLNGTDEIHYILKDNLGSWTAITDENGTVEQRLSYDAWGNLRNPNTWSGSFTGTPMFDRGYTGHEHLNDFGLVNMNGRVYDPVTSSFLSVDNYVQDPSYTQNFNRYAYCMINPLKYTDPDGEEFITAGIIIGGIILGAYTGGTLANGGIYNPAQWNWKNPATIIGIIGGGITGGLSSWAGIAVAGAGFSFCNTTAIASSSFAYSLGMHGTGLLAGFDYDISLSIGFASYNFSKKEFGYLFKKGNSILDNIGYGLGAITNICDINRFVTWDVLSKQQRYDKVQRWAEKHHGETNMEYNPKMNATGTYDLENDKIQLSDLALSEDFGWAKSSYLHELNHRSTMLPYKNEIERLSCLVAQGTPGAAETLAKYYAAFDSFAYETELINAASNGLSLNQFQRLNNLYLHYSLIGQRTGGNYNYSLWNLLKNILLP